MDYVPCVWDARARGVARAPLSSLREGLRGYDLPPESRTGCASGETDHPRDRLGCLRAVRTRHRGLGTGRGARSHLECQVRCHRRDHLEPPRRRGPVERVQRPRNRRESLAPSTSTWHGHGHWAHRSLLDEAVRTRASLRELVTGGTGATCRDWLTKQDETFTAGIRTATVGP